jgi:hypothetical protein
MAEDIENQVESTIPIQGLDPADAMIYPTEVSIDPNIRNFAKVRRISNQVMSFVTYQYGTTNNVIPEDTDHFYWLEFNQTAHNKAAMPGSSAAPEIQIKAYIDGEPIGDMDDFQVGVVWEPSIKKFLPKIDFGDMSREFFVFDYTTWQWKSPQFESGKMLIWNPQNREYEEYVYNNPQQV